MNSSIEHKILYEQLLQEAFLDSVKNYAQEKYNQVITKITDWKDAAVIIGKVISNPTILDRFSDNVWYDFKRNILSKLIAFLNKVGLGNLVTQINNIVNKITNLSGWQKFLAATGIGAIANYVIEKMSGLAPDAIKNFINSYLSDSGLKNIISKLTDFKSYLGWLQPIIKGTEMLYDVLKSSIDKFNKDSKLFTQSVNLIRKEGMDLKEYIKSLVRELLDEMSTSGDAGAYSTPLAFAKKGQGPNAATKQAQRSGWKLAPGMPKNSKVLDYKEMWPGKKSAMNENNIEFKVGDKVRYENQDWEIEKILDGQYRLKNLKGLPSVNVLKSVIEKDKASSNESINEGYAQFRNSTKQRSKPDQFHQAVKQVKQKMNEINRIFEYVDRLKSELSEGEDLKYKKYTENAFSQIKESAKQLFLKSTKLK
jgi:nitrogen regulatory protein PII-like uncharacterized protein